MSRSCSVIFMLLLFWLFDGHNLLAASSEQSINQQDDNTRFETLIDLADKAIITNPEQAMEYAGQALTIGEKKQEKKMIVQAQFILAKVNFVTQNFQKSIEYYIFCESFYENSGDAENLANVYNALSSAYFYISNSEMSDVYSDKCIALAEKHNFLDILNKQYYNRSAIAFYRGDYSLSMQYAFKALNIAKKIDQPIYMAYCYDLMGNLSVKISEFRKAINFYELSQTIYLAEENKIGRASCRERV